MNRLSIRSGVCILLALLLAASVLAAPNDSHYADQWTMEAIHYDFERMSELGLDGSGVCVAVIDSGICTDAPDLAGVRISPDSRNFLGTDTKPDAPEHYDRDQTGHGTMVAGRIAAQTDNAAGYASVAPGATLMILRCYAGEPNAENERYPYSAAYDEGSASLRRIGMAIRYAVDHGADVINMSFASLISTAALEDAVDYALESGVILVASAGNTSGSTVSRSVMYPAAYPGVVSVSSLSLEKGTLVSPVSSVENAFVDIAAPGENVDGIRIYQKKAGLDKNSRLWEDPEDVYVTDNCGTSFSAPIISGMAAIARQLCPRLRSEDFLKLLAVSCTDLGEAGRDDAFGYGAADLDRLVTLIRELTLTAVCGGESYSYPVGGAPALERPAREDDPFLGWRTAEGRTIYAAPEELPYGELVEEAETGGGAVRYGLAPLELVPVFESELPALFPPEPEPAAAALPFMDVSAADWYCSDVTYCWEKGLLNGVRADLFGAEELLTRAMAVTMLWRLDGEAMLVRQDSFPDVARDAWYADAVLWASADGIVQGDENGLFRPEALISREELAVLLQRYAAYIRREDAGSGKVPAPFRDQQQISDWAAAGVDWCVRHAILGGREDGSLDPLGTATRAEAAAMFHRFAVLMPEE